MVSVFKVIVFAANISAHVLTLGPEKDQALFDNYLSPMQVRIDLTVQFHQWLQSNHSANLMVIYTQ